MVKSGVISGVVSVVLFLSLLCASEWEQIIIYEGKAYVVPSYKYYKDGSIMFNAGEGNFITCSPNTYEVIDRR